MIWFETDERARELLLASGKELSLSVKVGSVATGDRFVATREVKDDIISACEQIKDGEFLPEKIKAGKEYIGPADWLYGALEVLLGAKSVTVKPKPQLPSLDCMPEVRDSAFKGTWQHSDSFEDKYLSDRLRYQSWTMRFRTASPTVEE
jgi:hypothetical protein